MKEIVTKVLAVVILTFAVGTMYSQFKITGEIRPRMEYRHGFKNVPDTLAKHALFVSQRTRLNFDFANKNMEYRLSLQDVRVWGASAQLGGNDDFGVSVHEAWGLAKLNANVGLKFGRQELVYDDHRMLGSVGWAQQARSHDAVVLKYAKDKMKLDVGLAYNQNGGGLAGTNFVAPNGASYKAMQYLWFNTKPSENLGISILAMNVGKESMYIDQTDDLNEVHIDNYTLTLGTRVAYKKDKLAANLNGYYQLGTLGTGNVLAPSRDVSAYNIGVDVSYQVMDPLKVTIGYEMLSGNSQTDTTTAYGEVEHAFNPYFGTNHKFNGHMDYFYVGNHLYTVGLNDLFFKLDYKADKFKVGAAVHLFSAGNDILDNDELSDTGNYKAMSGSLGTEIDIYAGFKLAPGTTCKVGYSQMFASETMEDFRGGDLDEIANWGYVMLILKPTLFDSKDYVKNTK